MNRLLSKLAWLLLFREVPLWNGREWIQFPDTSSARAIKVPVQRDETVDATEHVEVRLPEPDRLAVNQTAATGPAAPGVPYFDLNPGQEAANAATRAHYHKLRERSYVAASAFNPILNIQ
jgi:hypothetical protein